MINPLELNIYHITHIDNLKGIIAQECLWSDFQRIQRNLESRNIGYNHIKERRLNHLVTVSKKGTLGHYVPFNFCSRSVMLYVIHKGHENYNSGENEILHLRLNIKSVLDQGRPYFFTDRHADLNYARQSDNLNDLEGLDWSSIGEKYWLGYPTKELKQAEFLIHDFLPWKAILDIGVISKSMSDRVNQVLLTSIHQPNVLIKPEWYYS